MAEGVGVYRDGCKFRKEAWGATIHPETGGPGVERKNWGYLLV